MTPVTPNELRQMHAQDQRALERVRQQVFERDGHRCRVLGCAVKDETGEELELLPLIPPTDCDLDVRLQVTVCRDHGAQVRAARWAEEVRAEVEGSRGEQLELCGSTEALE